MPRMRAVPTGRKTRMGTVILSDGSLDYSFKGQVRLNRSQNWPRAQTYLEAREKAPYPRQHETIR